MHTHALGGSVETIEGRTLCGAHLIFSHNASRTYRREERDTRVAIANARHGSRHSYSSRALPPPDPTSHPAALTHVMLRWPSHADRRYC